jgi:hypothetical protein
MPEGYDFAIFGGSALAALLSGLLAHDHKMRVLRIAEGASARRLPRSIDIALPFATRPATWHLLRAAEAETIRLMASLRAPDAIAATAVEIVADHPGTADALAHMRHVAGGYGLPSRGNMFPDVSHLVRAVDLRSSAAQTVHPDVVELLFDGSGAAELLFRDERVTVGQIVLADDAAILTHLPEPQRPSSLGIVEMIATLTAPARRLPAPIRRYPDRGVNLVQNRDHSILALVAGTSDIELRLASTIVGPFPLQRVATSRFRRFTSIDGAPVIGRLTPSRLHIIAGLGDAGAFLAPPLARFITGNGTPEEKSWFAAHNPARPREAIADFVAVAEQAA